MRGGKGCCHSPAARLPLTCRSSAPQVVWERPMQPKALYRRAICKRLLGQLEGAREDLMLASQVAAIEAKAQLSLG